MDIWEPELSIDDCLDAGENGVMIPNDHYHALPGLSGSKIPLLEESNLHFDNYHLFNTGNKSCYDLGTHTHQLVLEPHLSNAVVIPKFESKAMCGMSIAEQKEEFLLDNPDALIIGQEDFDKAQRMAENVHAICWDILAESINERSIFAEYAPGVIIKCRIDCQHGADDYDLKTFSPPRGDMSERAIKHHCEAMGYYKSAALRNLVRQTLGVQTGDSYLIFVSTSPGHMVKIRKIPAGIISEYEDYCHDLLLLRRRYLKNMTDLDVKEILA
jgi:hypothetical protein